MSYPDIRLGLCCINIFLRHEKQIYTGRRKIMKQIEKQGLDAAKEVAIANVVDLAKMIFWNKNHGIDVTRISSDLVPHATNPQIIEKFGKAGEEYASLKFLKPYLKKVGHVIRAEKIRVSFHPSQFVQLASPTMSIYEMSVKELDMHVKYFELMGVDKNAVIVIHIGGTYKNKPETIARFIERFRMMPERIQERIVLENDEYGYDAEEVLPICETLKVPFVFDIFHYYCYAKIHPETTQQSIRSLMPRILQTWTTRGMRPKFHLSEQSPNRRPGSHAPFVERIPSELLQVPSKYGVPTDIMLEAKAKEIAIGRLYRKYPKLQPPYVKPISLNIPPKVLKELDTDEDETGDCKLCK